MVQCWTKSNLQRDPPSFQKFGDFSRRRLSPSPSTTTMHCSESTWKMATSLLRKRCWLTNFYRILKSLAKPLSGTCGYEQGRCEARQRNIPVPDIKALPGTIAHVVIILCCCFQVGDVEGAGKVLQMMKTAGIKVNENIFNSLIMGHGESGDLARAHGMLKVRWTAQ